MNGKDTAMKYTIFDTPILRNVLHIFSVTALRISGWRREGELPRFPKFVAITAPHTSNWDLPLALLLAFAFNIKVNWMGKDSLFRKPFGTVFKWLGGIPINRGKSSGMVEKSVQAFRGSERMILIIAPEGTRTKAARWRSGFYHIARGAGVPIVLGYLDYRRKAGGIGPILFPTGDIEGDMKAIRAFYADVTPKHPERMNQSLLHIAA
jgi:1-acyl-sn-glycerol-3-phosphate acyltransferase